MTRTSAVLSAPASSAGRASNRAPLAWAQFACGCSMTTKVQSSNCQTHQEYFQRGCSDFFSANLFSLSNRHCSKWRRESHFESESIIRKLRSHIIGWLYWQNKALLNICRWIPLLISYDSVWRCRVEIISETCKITKRPSLLAKCNICIKLDEVST